MGLLSLVPLLKMAESRAAANSQGLFHAIQETENGVGSGKSRVSNTVSCSPPFLHLEPSSFHFGMLSSHLLLALHPSHSDFHIWPCLASVEDLCQHGGWLKPLAGWLPSVNQHSFHWRRYSFRHICNPTRRPAQAQDCAVRPENRTLKFQQMH